jgi:hypothetical protein
VLTKPDTIQDGEHEPWLKILKGECHLLKHGWFVTRQCSMNELAKGLTWDQVRSLENGFFDTEEPWHNLDLRHRFGTKKLVAALSTLLSSMIVERYYSSVFF